MADRAGKKDPDRSDGNTAKKGKAREGSTGRRRKGAQSKKDEEQRDMRRRKELETSIRLQVAAEEKAHKIVEKLVLDGQVPREFLLTSGNFITPSHYSDVTQERSISCICGYPLCSNPLTQIPKQKYKISIRKNRVYDITERKCFCSNLCYKASKWFESQLLSSPVWARVRDEPNEFTLFSNQDEAISDHSTNTDPPTSRDNGRADEGLERAQDSHQDKDTRDTNSKFQDLAVNVKLLQKLPQDESTLKGDRTVLPDNSTSTCVAKQTDSINSDPCARSVQISSHTNKEELSSTEKERSTGTSDSLEQILVRPVMQVVSEWCTPATLCFLGCGQSRSPDETSEGISEGQHLTGDSESFSERALQFFQASHDKEDLPDESELDSPRNKASPENTIVIKERPLATEEETVRVVPPIGCKSHMTIRRRIVLQRLAQTLPNMLREVKLTMGEISADVTQLVHTFRLGNHNITLKPVQWSVLGLVLLEALRCRNLVVATALDSATKQSESLLRSLGLTRRDLDSILSGVFHPASAFKAANNAMTRMRRQRTTTTHDHVIRVHYGDMEELD